MSDDQIAATFAAYCADARVRLAKERGHGLMAFHTSGPKNPSLAEAITGMTVYDDKSWHCPDENGIPRQFFKDGTRRYS